MDAVERVSLIISDKLKSPVRCTFEDGVLKLLTTTVLGRASDECAVKGDGEGLEIGFNNKYLLDALKAASSEKICLQLSTGVAPCIIIPADGTRSFLYMILRSDLKQMKVKVTKKQAVRTETVEIQEPFIRLDALLKYSALADTGGAAKRFIQEGEVLVNGEVCLQRGRKIRPGDKVRFGPAELTVSNAQRYV